MPMTKLLQNKWKFVWDDKYDMSFTEFKTRLIIAPILTLPSSTGGFMNYNNTSLKGLCCVLMWYEKVVTYASR